MDFEIFNPDVMCHTIVFSICMFPLFSNVPDDCMHRSHVIGMLGRSVDAARKRASRPDNVKFDPEFIIDYMLSYLDEIELLCSQQAVLLLSFQLPSSTQNGP